MYVDMCACVKKDEKKNQSAEVLGAFKHHVSRCTLETKWTFGF